MKRLLIIPLIALFTITANAQSIYVAADMNDSFETPQRIDVGYTADISEATSLNLFTGYTNRRDTGNYTQIGVGLDYNFKLPFTVSFDVRGVFGKASNKTLQHTQKNDSGVAYSTFAGVQVGSIAIGASLEQYVMSTDNIFISPLAVRANF